MLLNVGQLNDIIGSNCSNSQTISFMGSCRYKFYIGHGGAWIIFCYVKSVIIVCHISFNCTLLYNTSTTEDFFFFLASQCSWDFSDLLLDIFWVASLYIVVMTVDACYPTTFCTPSLKFALVLLICNRKINMLSQFMASFSPPASIICTACSCCCAHSY